MGNICIHDNGADLPYKNRSCTKCGAPYKTYHNSRYSHRLSCRKHEFSKKIKIIVLDVGKQLHYQVLIIVITIEMLIYNYYNI